MRTTATLRATVKSAAKYLQANTPTGLTGLPTHPSPRPALVMAYTQTLERLSQLPESSIYRQSTEALTKHRLEIVSKTIPPGFDEWHERVTEQLESNPGYDQFVDDAGMVIRRGTDQYEILSWDGVVSKRDRKSEGSNTQADAEAKGAAIVQDVEERERQAVEGKEVSLADLESEPALTAEQ